MSETNILAIVAIVLSTASLAWQAASWLLSGPVIKVLITLDSSGVTVTAYNSGRAPATITAVEVASGGQAPVFVGRTPEPESDPIPFRLPEGGHASWRYSFPDGTTYRGNRRRSGRSGFNASFVAHVTVGLNKQVVSAPAECRIDRSGDVGTDRGGWASSPRSDA
jgi:hypothetical protein